MMNSESLSALESLNTFGKVIIKHGWSIIVVYLD